MPLECATHLTKTYGTIMSPRFMSQNYFYTVGYMLDCQWLIQLLPGQQIEMKFIEFYLGDYGTHGNCYSDDVYHR